jgi:ATP-dependent protease ClpP protease subunit
LAQEAEAQEACSRALLEIAEAHHMSNGIAASQLPKHIYGIFAGPIDQQAIQRISNAVTIAVNNGVENMHLLFQSTGGMVGDGVFLYNLFRSVPIDITLYNVGSIASIGVIAYLRRGRTKDQRKRNFHDSQDLFQSDRSNIRPPSIVGKYCHHG